MVDVRGDFRTINEKTDLSRSELEFVENVDDPVAKE